MFILLFGAPGVGKGTQAKLLQERRAFHHLSTGDLLRGAVKNGTELGRLAKSYMDKGELVPDNVMIGLVEEKIAHPSDENGFILDGFPRNEAQATALDNMLEKYKKSIDYVFNLEVSDEEIISRLSQRRVCVNCGATYNLNINPPSNPKVCTACGGEVIQRDDDSEETIRKRLVIYNDKTAPLINYYSKKGKLVKIHALGEIEDVFDRIISTIAVV